MSNNGRDAIRMTADELTLFLAAQKSLQVGTLDRAGSVHLSTLWFALVEGKIVFETYTKSQKIVNLRRDPRITVLAEDGRVYEELRGVMIKGTATLVDDPAAHAHQLGRSGNQRSDRPQNQPGEEHTHADLSHAAIPFLVRCATRRTAQPREGTRIPSSRPARHARTARQAPAMRSTSERSPVSATRWR